MKILMLSSTFPYPPTKGGTHNRTFNLLKPLTQNHSVTLLTLRSADVKEEEIEALRQWVDELVVFPRPVEAGGGIGQKLQRTLEFIQKGTPPNVRYLYQPAIQQWVDRAVEEGKFDAMTCEHSVNEIYVRPHWKNKLCTVVDIHSSVYRTCKNQLATGTSENVLRDRLYLPLLRRYERNYCQKFAKVVVTTDEDWQQMKEFDSNSDVTVVPNGVNLAEFTYREQDPGGHSLVFLGGMDYFVNIDAACTLARDILPLVQKKYPDTTLTLVGSKPSPEVLALGERPGVTVTGRVPSMTEYLHRATVFAAPLRAGFGMKIKTLEAMAAGAPVVGSDRTLEGLTVEGENVPLRALRANTPEEFVRAISRLFEDAELRAQLSANGRSLIESEFTWQQASANYERVLMEKH